MLLELTYTPDKKARSGAHPTARYTISGGLPWYRETEAHPDKKTAFLLAVKWAREYEKKDPYGNMASALGVIRHGDEWRGVVNYYHSNT